MAIITKEVEVSTNNQTVKMYEEKGYTIPKIMGKHGTMVTSKDLKMKVKVEDLSKKSGIKVKVECDDCHRQSETSYMAYNNNFKKHGKYVCELCIRETSVFRFTGDSFEDWCIKNNRQDVLLRWDYELNKCKPSQISCGSNKKFYFKCSKNPKHESEAKTICNFTKGVCDIPCHQCNSIIETHPHLIKYFLNQEDVYKYSIKSNKNADLVCPNCGNIKNMKICDLTAYSIGISCPKCGDGISYPEKMMFNILEQLGLDFITQLSKNNFSWCENYKYDFYIPKFNCIIETHGGQHYFETRGNTKWNNLEEVQKNDIMKQQLAIENKIANYIQLDCRYSDLEYIKNSLINSELNEILDLSKIDWLKCHEYGCNTIIKQACDLWNEGVGSTTVIGEKLKINRCTIKKYLQKGALVGWCNYDAKEETIKNNISNGKRNSVKVICLTTNEVFNNIVKASENFDISPSGITGVCKNKHNYCGKHPITKEPLRWQYYSDYLKQVGDKVV